MKDLLIDIFIAIISLLACVFCGLILIAISPIVFFVVLYLSIKDGKGFECR